MLYLDLETRSGVDLIFHGLRRYVEDASTEVICMAYAFDDGPIEFWWGTDSFPQEVKDYIDSGKPVMAHNAAFEKAIFDKVLSR